MKESRDLRADDRGRRRCCATNATGAAFRSGPRRSASSSRCLAAILDDAIEDGHIERNPARDKRMRVRVPKPQRSFLELDELRALMDAAAAQDPTTGRVKPPPRRRRDRAQGRGAAHAAA